ncbi:hypothetical protein HAX54_052021 [Datura stramonium]|uniref:Uncharacterized protein n=1 Tax=Datura stramonium TaxID=4076 RepID=A0ABS8WRZ2_DATST|nr:hypothetical protein [Datura stramonium]
MLDETSDETQVQARGYRPVSMPCVSPALHGSRPENHRCGADSKYSCPVLYQMPAVHQCFATLHLRLTGGPPISNRDWGPFTIPMDPYFPEFVWEFYAPYNAQQIILKHKGRVDTIPCLPSVLVQGQEGNITLKEINSIYCPEPI